MSSYQMTWSIIAAPSQLGHRKYFLIWKKRQLISALWDAIFEATRVDQEDPVQTWHEHNATLRSKREQLTRSNSIKFITVPLAQNSLSSCLLSIFGEAVQRRTEREASISTRISRQRKCLFPLID